MVPVPCPPKTKAAKPKKSKKDSEATPIPDGTPSPESVA
jgi:hypothetical protein